MPTRVSVANDGAEGDGDSYEPSISADGRYVAYTSNASNLAPDDTNGHADIFLFDSISHTTTLISRAIGGAQADGDSSGATISDNGRYVTFESTASNLVAGDTNGALD